MYFPKNELKLQILRQVRDRSPQPTNKFNLLGRQGLPGELERSLKTDFELQQRALAYSTFEELKAQGLIIPTYTDLVDPENWVVITESGKKTLVDDKPQIERPAETASDLTRSIPKIFLSHATSDAAIAGFLKDEIERRLPGVEVFRSSDPASLPPGSKWPKEIQDALETSCALVLIATSRGLQRTWVWFECGSFWFRERKLIPLCFGEVRKGQLIPPFWELQALNADSKQDLQSLFATLAKLTDTKLMLDDDADGLVEQLKSLEGLAATQVAHREPGWIGAEWEGHFLAYKGPNLEGLRQEEDGIYKKSMAHALESEGFKVRLANPKLFGSYVDAGWRVVYLTDRRGWRRKVVLGDLMLAAVPTSKPLKS